MTDSVTRWVITCKHPGKWRRLATAQQGRCTYATPGEAQATIDAIRANNPRSLLNQVYGDADSLEIRSCPCYPVHFDPRQYVWDDNAGADYTI